MGGINDNKGVGVTSNPAAVGVASASSTNLRPANPGRNYLMLCNNSAVVIHVKVDGTPAVVNEGIRLNAAGSAGDRVEFTNYVPIHAINAIAASASGNKVSITEA